MRTMPDGYADAVASNERDVSIYLSLGTNIDTTSADDITAITGGSLPMSNTAQVTDAVYAITSGMAVYEGNGIPTSVSSGKVAPPLSARAYPPETGLWSDVISDADGNIEWTFTITLSADHTSAFRLYTDGPAITSGSVAFTSSSGTTETESLVCSEDYAQVLNAHTYSSIVVTITGISHPYRHVRIVECEFGSSRSISGSETTGETTLIDEIDPTEQTMPMRELDFELINVEGDYDPDNPDSRLGELAVGYPISLSFTVEYNGSRYTVPMGRFVIGTRESSDTSIKVSAFDARYPLTDIYGSWSIDASTSLGKSIDSVLTQYTVPHYIDEAMFSAYPDAAYTFPDTDTIQADLLMIEQAYGVYFVPDRDGTIHVTQTWPTGTANAVPVTGVYAWPAAKQRTRYNYIVVTYTLNGVSGTVEKDLRTDTTESKSILSIGNALITTSARATTVLNRIAGRIRSAQVEVDWIGDPAMDLGDTISIPGKWSTDAPLPYVADYTETTFEGVLRAVMRASR